MLKEINSQELEKVNRHIYHLRALEEQMSELALEVDRISASIDDEEFGDAVSEMTGILGAHPHNAQTFEEAIDSLSRAHNDACQMINFSRGRRESG
jgi:predicted metal-dependent peptidase